MIFIKTPSLAKAFTLSIAIVFIGLFSFETRAQESERDEAKAFAMEVVGYYFNQDCDAYYQALTDTLLRISGKEAVSKLNKKEKICSSVRKAIRIKEKSLEDYLNTYQVNLYNSEELEKKFNYSLPDFLGNNPSDYYFIGGFLNEGIPKTEQFIFDDMFSFMLRKIDGVWRIKAIN